jgi:hypothetical protein
MQVMLNKIMLKNNKSRGAKSEKIFHEPWREFLKIFLEFEPEFCNHFLSNFYFV